MKPSNRPQALQIAAGCAEALRHPAPGAHQLGLLLQTVARCAQAQGGNPAVVRSIRMW